MATGWSSRSSESGGSRTCAGSTSLERSREAETAEPGGPRVSAERNTGERHAGERFLVTGALGCIGAWTVRELVREGVSVVAFDVGRDTRRLALVMTPDELARVTFVVRDITDLDALQQALDDHDITNVVHLAA